MSRRKVLWLLAIPLLVAMTWSVARRGRYTVPLSTWSTASDGAKALFTFLEETGRAPARWTQDLGRLPDGGMLFALGDGRPARNLGRREKDRLKAWISAGGTLVLLGVERYVPRDVAIEIVRERPGESAKPAGATPLFPDWEDAPAAQEDDEDARPKPERVALADHPLAQGLATLGLRRAGDVKVDVPGWELLVGDIKAPRGVVVPYGRGYVVAIGSASFVTNSDLGTGDHAPFVARIVDRFRGNGRVFFDEYHLGMGRGRSIVSYLRVRGFGPPLLQLVLVLGLVLLRVAVRFGSPIAPPRPPPDDAATYVEGMARIYARAADVPASIDRVAKDAYARLAARHGLPPPSGALGLAEALRKAGRKAAADAVDEVESRRTAVESRDRKGPELLVAFTREVDRLIAPDVERRSS